MEVVPGGALGQSLRTRASILPELPEVETTRRGLAPLLLGRKVVRVRVRNPHLRWPVSPRLSEMMQGHPILSLDRRAKYLILGTAPGSVIVHLGMSGSLRITPTTAPYEAHDHVVWELENDRSLRLRDHRRFGAALWCEGEPEHHPLLSGLGPEPLDPAFDGAHLHERSRGRRVAVKAFLMDGKVVAGIGNIYATEALFRAGIHPRRAAGRIGSARYHALGAASKMVLAEAIDAGGTTLKDFAANGAAGNYQQELQAYGRGGHPCPRCATPLRQMRISQRATVYCPRCQR